MKGRGCTETTANRWNMSTFTCPLAARYGRIIAGCGWQRHCPAAMLACLRQLFTVDPANGAGFIIALFRHNPPVAEIRAALKTLKDAGGTITPELEIIVCKLDRRAGQDTYKKVLAVLLNNPDTPAPPNPRWDKTENYFCDGLKIMF